MERFVPQFLLLPFSIWLYERVGNNLHASVNGAGREGVPKQVITNN
jgi:hypothetical protein